MSDHRDPDQIVGARRVRFGLGSLLAGIAVVALCGGLWPAVEAMREAGARSSCNLKGMGLAFHNYHDTHGRLPPAVVHGPDGEPLYSWRVLLLPYLEKDDLYREFHLDEPWNSPHNIRLVDQMPTVYEVPWKKREVPAHHTVYRVFVGPGTAFEDRNGLHFSDFPDGTSNTLLFVEAGEPIPWTKPDEITFDPDSPVNLKGLFRDGFRACTVDTAYRFIRHDTDQAILHAMITRNGGESPPFGP